MSKHQGKARPDPREQLTWWPMGFCSAWDERKQKCSREGGCACLKQRAHGKRATTGEQR